MKRLLNKSLVVRPLVAITILAFMNLSFTVADKKEVVLRAGTLVPLETMNEINTKYVTAGQMIDFKVTSPIIVNQNTVIPVGAIAKGQVTRFEKRGALGKGASLQVQIRNVTAIDGSVVMLTGGDMSERGRSILAWTIVLTILCACPIFLVLPGGNAVIPAGRSVSATVATDTHIRL